MAVYLDNASTAPLSPAAAAKLAETLQITGNPASIHSHGQFAKQTLEESREILAAGLAADPIELIFTSGGTESINTALKGLYWQRQLDRKRPLVVIAEGEHHAVMESAEWLAQAQGAEIAWVPIDAEGFVSLEALADLLAARGDEIALVSVLWANNEIGTVQHVEAIAELTAEREVPLHLDAVSAYGYLPVGLLHPGITAVSVTSHKIGGPAGIGALLLRRAATVAPILHGGSHERKIRSGSQAVALAASFAAAWQDAQGWDIPALIGLRNELIAGVQREIPAAVLRGSKDLSRRLPGNAHFTFEGTEGETLLFLLDSHGFSVSTGSACQAGVPEVSHVLLALGLSEQQARSALRFSLGHTNTREEIRSLLKILPGLYSLAVKARQTAR